MAIGYRILAHQHLVFIRGWDSLGFQQLLALASCLRADRAFRPEFDAVADLRDVTRVMVTSDQAIGGIPSAFARSARRAVIAGPSEVFGMARVYQVTANLQSDTLHLCPDLAAALAWLGREATIVWPSDLVEVPEGTE